MQKNHNAPGHGLINVLKMTLETAKRCKSILRLDGIAWMLSFFDIDQLYHVQVNSLERGLI